MMGAHDLRIVEESVKGQRLPEPTVRMKLGEIFPLLAHAHRHNFAWLKDMADDPIAVTMDLAQILHLFSTIEQERLGA